MWQAYQVPFFKVLILFFCLGATNALFALKYAGHNCNRAMSGQTTFAARKTTNEPLQGINYKQEGNYLRRGPVLNDYDDELSAAKFPLSVGASKLSRTIQFATQLEEIIIHSQKPTNEQFESVVEAWIRVGQADKAETLFHHVIDSNKLRLSRSMYRVLINAYVNAENFSRALEILDAMEKSPLTIVHPKTLDYNLILAGYASHRSTYVRDAEQLMEQMRRRKDPICRPDVFSYSHLVDMLLHSGYKDIGDRIEDVLNHLDSLPPGNGSTLSKKEQEYQSIYRKSLKFWKQSCSPDAARCAEAILRRMEEFGLADSISYAMYMGILIHDRYDVEVAETVSTICENMLRSYVAGNENVKPTCQVWNTVLSAWVRCGQPKRAEGLLNRMQRDFGSDPEMAPTVVSYSTVMDGWAKSSHVDAVENMENLFVSMQQLSASSGVKTTMSLQPNQWTYTSLIHAYAKQNDVISTQKAENLIREMYEQYLTGNTELKPNTILVTAVLQAWGKTGTLNGAEKSEALLDWMIAVDQTDESRDLAPNEFSFSTVIAAWGRSRCIGKSSRACGVLKKMIQLHESGRLDARPNTVCFTAVINACAYCENDHLDKRDSLRIAIQTYKDLEKSKYGKPNQVTYSCLLSALRNLLPESPQRSVAVQDVLRKAIRNGYVDQNVIQQVKFLLSETEIQIVYPSWNGKLEVNQLPSDWSRNVLVRHA